MSNDRFGAVVLSNCQHTLLHEAVADGGITLERMLQLRQGTAGSLIKRNYFTWDGQTEMFVVTDNAMRVMVAFEETDITRKTTYRPLSVLIKDRSVHRVSERRREELKLAHQQAVARERESEKDKVKRQRATMKAGAANGNGHSRSKTA